MTYSPKKNYSPGSRSSTKSRLEVSSNPWRHLKPFDRNTYRISPFKHPELPSPLSDRDLEILGSWFDREDMDEIEAEINQYIQRLPSELLWDEDLELL